MRRLAGRRERPSLPSASLCGGGGGRFWGARWGYSGPSSGRARDIAHDRKEDDSRDITAACRVGSVPGRVGRARRVR